MDWMNIAVEYIKPELLILVFVLWYIGTLLKKTEKVDDWKIPFILMLISIVMCVLWVFSINGASWLGLWVGLMQGLVIAAVEGQGYQLFKQLNDRQ